jgi:chemotaxis protein MotB
MATDTAERSSVELGRPRPTKKSRPASGTPWVLLVFALGAGGFVAWELKNRVTTARAAAERATTELELTRQRAFDAERQLGEAQSALLTSQKEADELRTQNLALTDENAKLAPKAAQADQLAVELAKSVKADEGELKADDGKLTLDLLDKVLFSTGKAELTPSGKKVLKRVGDLLNKFPDRQIWVIGHTDDIPIKSAEFLSNWELSTARALNVVHFLIDDVKVSPRRLAAAGFGPYRPVSKANRARNRRIELVLFPKDVKFARP